MVFGLEKYKWVTAQKIYTLIIVFLFVYFMLEVLKN